MIAHLTVMAQSPGSRNIFLSLVEIALGKMDPTQRVPIGNQRRHEREVLLRKAVERQIAQRRSRGRDGGLGVLLCAVQMLLLQRELVSNIVPHQWRGGDFYRMVERR